MLSFQDTLQVLKVNLRIAFQNNLILAILLLLMTPVIFGIRNLDFSAAASVCEQFIALIGILLIAPLFMPEEDKSVKETIKSKAVSILYVYLLRIIISLLIAALLIVLLISIMLYLGGSFAAGKLIAGTFASALFLGALGLFAAAITENTIIGYMTSLLYFIFDAMTKGKYLKPLFLFSFMHNSFREKYYLMIAGTILLILTLMLQMVKNRRLL